MTTTATISRDKCENIATTIRSLRQKITERFDLVELLAASHALNEEFRGFRADSTVGRREAAETYLRRLPRDEESAQRQLKTDAAAALGEPEILEDFERMVEARRKADDALAEIQRIEQAPITRKLEAIRREEWAKQNQRKAEAWDIARLDAIENSAKRTLLELVGTKAEDSMNGAGRIKAAIAEIQYAKILKELAPEAMK